GGTRVSLVRPWAGASHHGGGLRARDLAGMLEHRGDGSARRICGRRARPDGQCGLSRQVACPEPSSSGPGRPPRLSFLTRIAHASCARRVPRRAYVIPMFVRSTTLWECSSELLDNSLVEARNVLATGETPGSVLSL